MKAELRPRHGDYAHVPLGSVTEIIMGQAPPGSDCNKEGRGTVFVKAGEFDDRFPLICEWTTRPLKLARAGDVLVCVVGATAGKINEAIDCAIGRSVASVRPLKDVSSGFLYHFLLTRVQFLRAKSQGLAQGVITREMLQQLEFPLPPLAEQRRITEVLDRAEALRAKRRAALAQLDSLTESLFLDLFGDPATNPKRFPILTFAEACERIFKGAFDLKAASYQTDGIPFIRIANIRGNTIDLTDAVYLDERAHKQYQGSELLCGDLVFSKVGTIDRIAVIPNSIPRCNISQNNVGAKLRHTIALPVYALALLTSPYALAKIRAGSKKAVQDKLVLEELRMLPFLLPPIDLQREFARRVGAAETLKMAQRASLAEMDALFASLQHRAFRGDCSEHAAAI